MRIKIRKILEDSSLIGKEVTVKGWVRSLRRQKQFAFIEVNDGSCLANLQAILDSSLKDYEALMDQVATGASVALVGKVSESPGKGQKSELHASRLEIIGHCDPESYPLQKKRHSFEFLRTIAHLRPRTNTIGSVMRVRNALAFSTHRFFQERGFHYLQSPIITSSDCEGAGKMFRVTTLDPLLVSKQPSEKIDSTKDFFGKPAYLTVSGQLNGEIYASALADVYTFGPTFRAENSNTSRHLAEFWMVEPEMAFADLKDDMDLAEEYLKYVFNDILSTCEEDMHFFERFICKGVIDRLKTIVEEPFERITYTQAVDILQQSGQNFEFEHAWGCDFQSEHERYLCEKHFKKPLIVTDYPEKIKSFYMRSNDDGTVAAMDILVAGVGEIIGGSQREERHDVLLEKMRKMDLDPEPYWWYLELRKYGTVPHAGFGAGFERLVQFVTGMENIRDVIPFPRYPGHADF